MFWISGLLGLLLGLAPFTFGYADHPAALWTSVVLGGLVVLIAIIGQVSTAMDKRWEYWVIGLSGLAAFIAPFVFGYSVVALLWSSLILGALLVVLDGYKAFQAPPTMEHSH